MRIRIIIFLCMIVFLTSWLIACDPDEPTTNPNPAVVVYPKESGMPAYLFTASHYMDKVYRINLESLDVDEVSVGEEPRTLAASSDGMTIAVANKKGESISIINALSLNVATIRTGYTPRDVKFSPDDAYIAVANFDNETVSLIDARTREQWDFWVGGGPANVAFDQNSRFLAVACYNEDSVQALDVRKLVTGQFLEVGFNWQRGYDRPQVLTFGKEGTPGENFLFVGSRNDPYDYETNSYADSIAVLQMSQSMETDPSFVPKVTYIKAAPNPSGFIWSHAGDMLFSINPYTDEWGDNNVIDTVSVIYPISPRDTPKEAYRFVMDDEPVAAALSPNESVMAIANMGGHSVILVYYETGATRRISTEVKPYALAFNPSGTKIVVVHDTPLMPVSMIDVASGSSKVVIDSVTMFDYVD